MLTVNPQYITDNTGKKISVVLSMKDFKAIMEELEELEDIKLYDEAKKEDTGERILFSEYVKNRKEKNA
jgi:PHD/YefM family antitoxin component YafN of YafNO toxin-antitoxin module